jgi:beta-lactamase class A
VVASSLAVALTITVACGCSPSPASPFSAASSDVPIDTKTPPGLRAKQVWDMLNSDWPIGPASVGTLATPNRIDPVVTTMDGLWWDRPFSFAGVDIHAGAATLRLISSYGAQENIQLHVNGEGLVDRFDVSASKPKVTSWADLDATLSRTGANYSYQAARVNDGRCEPVAGTNTSTSLPLASIFKLYVLYAVANAVRAGTMSWDDPLTITTRAKVVGSSGLEKLPHGAQVSVRTAAEKMIAKSDNMATDLLISKVGTDAVEEALAESGHHDPTSMTPFPTMYELFSVGWGEPDMRLQWQNASPNGRAQLLQQANSRPYQPDPTRAHIPASEYGAEWYASAQDICRVHAALQTGAVGAAAPVTTIMSTVAGIELDRAEWPYIGAKGGGLPGDLTFSWYAVDKSDQPWVVSVQLNWARDHGPRVSSWVIQLARQMFAMLPR